MKLSKKLLLFIILGISIMNEIQAVTDTSEYTEPVYTVQISYAGTGAEFRLNDIPYYLETFSGQVDTEIPVSDKMINGINQISIIAFPYSEGSGPLDNWTNEDARVEATLYVREKSQSKESRKLLTNIKLYPLREMTAQGTNSAIISGQDKPTIDYKIKPRQFSKTRYTNQVVINRLTHVINTPFKRWEWQDAEIIEDTQDNYNSLLEAYRKEYIIHQEQNIQNAKASHLKLAETQNIINYYNDIDKAYDILNLEESWKSEEQELFSFIEGKQAEVFEQKLCIYANGKLASITNPTNIQPILYIIKNKRLSIKYLYKFYKNKNGEWIYVM